MTVLPLPRKNRVAVVPSILSADAADLGAAVRQVEKAGADWVQIDVMDGHFVPNISYGPVVVAALRKNTRLALDAHLMIENPEFFAESFRKAGADLITVHLETVPNPVRLLKKIRAMGAKAGLAINPTTPVEKAKPFLKFLDLLLVMTVQPGFGGQKFIPASVEKIARARKLISACARPIWLQVDGGISAETAALAAAAGADSLVAGNAVFGAKSPAKALQMIRTKASGRTDGSRA